VSDELKTGEQALAEGRGKIELPEAIEGVEMAAVAPEPIDAVAEHEKGSMTVADIVKAATGFPDLKPSPDFDFGGLDIKAFSDALVVGKVHDETILETKTKNALGTQDFCPSGLNCKHRSPDYCRQAKLEADHKAGCPNCACFHPARGIPAVFRGDR
jgi:hypothetical protein